MKTAATTATTALNTKKQFGGSDAFSPRRPLGLKILRQNYSRFRPRATMIKSTRSRCFLAGLKTSGVRRVGRCQSFSHALGIGTLITTIETFTQPAFFENRLDFFAEQSVHAV